MAFDFPASPVVGTVVTFGTASYQWDGQAWVGGIAGGGGGASIEVSDDPPASPQENALWFASSKGSLWLWYEDPQGDKQWIQVNAPPGGPGIAPPVTEQFFDLSGKTVFDIPVPSWAKHVDIEGCIYISVGTIAPIVQVSVDGSTFLSGAANYAYGGSVLNSGTGAHQQVPTNTTLGLWLSFLGDNAVGAMPHLFTADLQLVRLNSSPNLFTMKSYAKSYDSGASNLYRSSFIHAYVAAAATTALAVKALRFTLNAAGSFNPGSWVKVNWIGDSAQIPTGNAIAEAPMDGGEYVRINGVWRLKAQSFVMDGAAIFDISVPPGAKTMRALGSVQHTAGGGACSARASWDGVNFPVSASDYHSYVGFIHYSGSATPGIFHLVSTVSSTMNLTFNNDGTVVTDMFDWRQNIIRPNTGVAWSGLVSGMAYQTSAANLYNTSQHRVAVMHTNAGTVLDLKKFRFYNTNGSFGVPSTLDVTWGY